MIGSTIKCGAAVHHFDASSKLKHWSRKISDALEAANISHKNQHNSGHGPVARQSISDEITEMKVMLSELLRDRRDAQLRFEETKRHIIELHQIIQDLHTDQDRLRVDQQRNATHLPEIKTSIAELTCSLKELSVARKNLGVEAASSQLTPDSQQSHGLHQNLYCQNSTSTIQEENDANQHSSPEQRQSWQPLHPAIHPADTMNLPTEREDDTNEVNDQPDRQPQRGPMFLRRLPVNERTSTGTGRSKNECTLKHIMLDLYDNDNFKRLRWNPTLEPLWQHINGKFFNSARQNKHYLIAALQLVDAIWTKEEREQSIQRTFKTQEAAMTANQNIGDLCRRALHVLSNPSHPCSTSRRKTALVGMGTALKKIPGAQDKVKSHIPSWLTSISNSENTLRNYVLSEESRLKQKNRSR